MPTNPGTEAAARDAASASRLVFIDIGKRKRRQVKKLKKGGGPLAEKVERKIAQLKSEGALDPAAQTVVVVVRQKRRRSRWPY